MSEYIKREAVEKAIDNVYTDLYPEYVPNSIAAFRECLMVDVGIIPAADVEPSDRWINAQTNPPIATDGETSDYVLVLRADGRQCVCYYIYDDNEGNCWCSEDEKSIYDIDEVTHWQPLPKTPKEN